MDTGINPAEREIHSYRETVKFLKIAITSVMVDGSRNKGTG
jgi:hypothetical protein